MIIACTMFSVRVKPVLGQWIQLHSGQRSGSGQTARTHLHWTFFTSTHNITSMHNIMLYVRICYGICMVKYSYTSYRYMYRLTSMQSQCTHGIVYNNVSYGSIVCTCKHYKIITHYITIYICMYMCNTCMSEAGTYIRRWLWSHQCYNRCCYVHTYTGSRVWMNTELLHWLLHGAFCICRGMLHSPYSAMYRYIYSPIGCVCSWKRVCACMCVCRWPLVFL